MNRNETDQPFLYQKRQIRNKNVLFKIQNNSHPKFRMLDDLFTSSVFYYRINETEKRIPEYNLHDFIQENKDNIYSISTIYSWTDFKKSIRSFNFSSYMITKFRDTQYEIIIFDEIVLTKFYDEEVSDSEIDGIVIKWVKKTLMALNKNIDEFK